MPRGKKNPVQAVEPELEEELDEVEDYEDNEDEDSVDDDPEEYEVPEDEDAGVSTLNTETVIYFIHVLRDIAHVLKVPGRDVISEQADALLDGHETVLAKM